MVFYLAAIEGVFHKSFKKKKKKSSFTEMESEDSFFLTIMYYMAEILRVLCLNAFVTL